MLLLICGSAKKFYNGGVDLLLSYDALADKLVGEGIVGAVDLLEQSIDTDENDVVTAQTR